MPKQTFNCAAVKLLRCQSLPILMSTGGSLIAFTSLSMRSGYDVFTRVCGHTGFLNDQIIITLPYFRHFLRQSTVCHSQQVAQRPFGLARLGLNWLSWESGRQGRSPERAKTNQSAGAKIFGSDHLEPVTNFLLKMQQRRATSWSFELKLGFWFGLGSVRLGKVQVF